MYLNLEIKELDLINLSIIYCSEQMFIDKYHQSDIYCIGANKIFAPSGFINKLANSYKFLKDSNESEVIWDANYYDLIIFKDIISINNNLNEYDKFSQKVMNSLSVPYPEDVELVKIQEARKFFKQVEDWQN